MERMEYQIRETNSGKPPVGGIIPQAQSPPLPSSPQNAGSPRQKNIFEAAGVVMSTDSEESEMETDSRKKVVPM